ncbi:MAG: acyl-CoA dehydrogenase family protein [Planctomycetes bacterium]|nr:acyl-CoA dehydrogenase family protein [Planctomycetota bacterium]
MDFDLREELVAIRDLARDFAKDVCAPGAAERDRKEEFPVEAVRKAGVLGLMGLLVPEKYGGSGLGNMALCLSLIEVNKADASVGVTLSVHNSLCSSCINSWGSEELKRKYLPRLASGELLGAYALSETGSGSDAGSLTCKAVRDGDHYVVTGSKAWITSGDHADVYILFARTGGEGNKGVSAFVAERAWKGLTVGKKEPKLGIRSSSTVQIHFDKCKVPASNLLGELNQGFKVALHTLDGGRIGIACQALGIMEACLEASVKYARERKQFDKPIGEFQAIQWKLAEMKLRIDAARLLIFRAATLRDAGKPHGLEAAEAKLFASQSANWCATQAVQVHGGAGYCADFPVERYFRDARITEIYEGTTEIQKVVIARHLLRE